MKRLFKILAIVLLVVIVGGAIAVFALSEDVPVGASQDEARAMAEKMQKAINIDAWNSLRYVSWDFAGRNQYIWDKFENTAQVTTGEAIVMLNLLSKEGTATVNGQKKEGEEKDALLRKAWANFCNDSFWLNAPAKIFDEGAELSLVTQEDGSEGLKVTYTSGGVTPGDTYVWTLDDQGLPTSYKMWTQILPIGGLELSWEDYQTLPGGALVASKHVSPAFTLLITDIKGGMTLEEVQ